MSEIEEVYDTTGSFLCHFVIRSSLIREGRNNIIPNTEPLQLCTLRMNQGDTFVPHVHVRFEKTVHTTQESWVVIKGKVKVLHFDIEGRLLNESILEAGDVTVTLYGGHTYESLDNDTVVYEFKTGPYLGIEKDKQHITDPRKK